MSTAQKVWFCTQTKFGRVLLALAQMMSPAVGAVLVLWIIYNVEMLAAPVVRDFQVTRIERVDGFYLASGTYYKKRSCELVITNIIGLPVDPKQPSVLVYQVMATDAGSNLPVGSVKWGPYKIPAPAGVEQLDHVDIIGIHRCHALWNQSTHYATLTLAQLNQIR